MSSWTVPGRDPGTPTCFPSSRAIPARGNWCTRMRKDRCASMSEYEPGEGTRESDRHAEVSVVMPCQSTRGANRPVPKCAADPDGGESTRREQAIGGGAADGESV